jgi:NAD(P)-dependent dehydrogenase (short-subunit alcohol dehydrogenase family)
MGNLSGKVALITGGARGQGRSHALALAAEGVDLVVCDIGTDIAGCAYGMGTKEDLDETVRLIGKEGVQALGIVADMRETDAVQRVVDAAIERFGRIDILCANHGYVAYSTVEDTTDEFWQEMIDNNLTGIFKITRAVVPQMKRQGFGRIMLTASHIARRGIQNTSAYAASKWGVIGFMKCLAFEVGPGITVNAICPTMVDTRMVMNESTYRLFCPDIEQPTRADFEARIVDPFGKGWYTADNVSRLVTFLANDVDGVYTGQVLDIAMGLTAAMSV